MRYIVATACLVVAAAALAPAAWGYDGGSVAAGDYANCAIRTDGHIDCWGRDWTVPPYGSVSGPNGSTDTFTQISAFNGATCGVDTASRLHCWGADTYARSGFLADVNASTGAFTQVAVTYQGACGLQTDGHVTCFGGWQIQPSAGQLDTAGLLSTGTYTQVSVGSNVQEGYGDYGCALSTAGHAVCWGWDWSGYVASFASHPTAFTQISAGTYGQVCGVEVGGRIFCVGPDAYGSVSGPDASTDTFTQVSTGHFGVTCGVKTDGHLRCWGNGTARW